jgi:tetratricopeptide (TPR) repeat protein
VRSRQTFVTVAALLLLAASPALAADPAEVQRGLLAGNYTAVIKQARGELRDAPANTEWSMLLVQALLATGRYADADAAIKTLNRDPRSIRLRWLAREVVFANGRPDEAARRIDDTRGGARCVMAVPGAGGPGGVWPAALVLGADPGCPGKYSPPRKGRAEAARCLSRARELAMEKHDFALAAKAYEEGLKQRPTDPDLLSGRGRPMRMATVIALQSLQAALKENSRHEPTLPSSADHHIDAENYEEAERCSKR